MICLGNPAIVSCQHVADFCDDPDPIGAGNDQTISAHYLTPAAAKGPAIKGSILPFLSTISIAKTDPPGTWKKFGT
jgi:hypothetical protein